MSLRNILKYAFIGTIAYGIYKLGQSQGGDLIDWIDDVIKKNQMAFNEQVDFIREQILKLKNKSDKTIDDQKNIDKLNQKLDNLTNSK